MNSQNMPETDPSYTGEGYIIVRVSTADNAIPLAGASVSIRGGRSDDSSGVIAIFTTDRSGKTPRFALPTLPRSLSEVPGNANPFATYNIDVDLEGYTSQYFQNVPIFDGITSLQNAALIPLPKNGIPDSRSPDSNVFFEGEKPNL